MCPTIKITIKECSSSRSAGFFVHPQNLWVNRFYQKATQCHFAWAQWHRQTHLAPPLGVEACRYNYHTRFFICYALSIELIEARNERELQRIIQRYARYKLLILDEPVLTPTPQNCGRIRLSFSKMPLRKAR